MYKNWTAKVFTRPLNSWFTFVLYRLFQNVKKKNEEKKNTAETNEEEIKKIELKKKYGQTHKSVSLYELFQSFKKTAILEKT